MASAEQLKKFEDDGYFVMEDFLSHEDCDILRADCKDLVEEMNPEDHHTIFNTEKTLSYRDDYFMNSSDKIGFFFEDGALDENGKLQVDKHRSLNKIGHALHVFCPNFKRVTSSDKIKALCKSVGYDDPVIVQSMYIFKQPGIGGKVGDHQDATYLYTDPIERVMGLWIALEDATLENGCLWFIPGSHKEGVFGNYRMVRNPDKKEGDPSCIYIGDKPTFDENKFEAVPVKKGDLVAIHGCVIHKSAPNKSKKSRHIYTFHMYDKNKGVWDEKNWLQPTPANTFTHLYDM